VEEVDVVVVGAGIAGLSAAWRLAAAGTEALVLERFALGHDRGSSHGATRIFRFAYDDPTYVRMAQAALPLWRELEAISGEEILRVTGGFDAGPDPLLDAIKDALHVCGAEAIRIDGAESRHQFPWIDLAGADTLFSPDTGVLAAARALEALASAARSRGAELRENRPVRSLAPDDEGVTVATDGGEIRARRVVVAAGAWAKPLLEPLGVKLPVRVTCEQVFYFRGPDDVRPFIHHGDISRYSVPAFAGAPGIKLAEHTTGEETSADGRSFEMDPEGAARVAAYVERTLPLFDPEPVAFETCLYTNTPDGGFVIDRVGPVVVASPCSGHGFKFGPFVGEILAGLATEREPVLPLAPFALNRF
jgi:sarcosine oxidase